MYCIEFGHTMQPIQRVAVVGAGNMGSGIAQKSAQEEFDVQMVDRELQWVERGQSIIANFLEEAVERRIFSPAQVDAIQGRITGVVGVENTAENTDLVIEAVFEDFDVKTAVFNALDSACGEGTILASNTSSLSVNALAEATGVPIVSSDCISSITLPKPAGRGHSRRGFEQGNHRQGRSVLQNARQSGHRLR